MTNPITSADLIHAASDSKALDTATLPDVGTLTGAEVLPATRAGGLLQTSLTKLAAWILSAYVGFTQVGAGAIARPVTSKLADVVSVKDFGAKGDGVTNDTAAIQAALNSGALSVYIPTGRYIHTGLTLPTTYFFTLYGDGVSSCLVQTGGSIAYPVNAVTVVSVAQTIRDLAFDGTLGTANTLSTQYAQVIDMQNLVFWNTPVGFSSLFLDGNPTGNVYMHDVRVNNIRVYTNTAGKAGIELGTHCSDSSINKFIMNGNFETNYCLYANVGALTTTLSGSHPYNAKINVIKLAGGNNYFGWDDVTFDNSLQDVFYSTDSSMGRFSNCYFEAVPATYSSIVFDAASNNNLMTNTLFSSANGALAAVREIGGSQSNKIHGAQLDNAPATPFLFSGAGSVALMVPGYSTYGTVYPLVGTAVAAQAQNTTENYGANSAAGLSSVNAAWVIPMASYVLDAVIATDQTPTAGQTFTFNLYLGTTVIATGVISNGQYSVTLTPAAPVYASPGSALYIQSQFSATSGSASPRYSVTLQG